jgi:hypothetical protein
MGRAWKDKLPRHCGHIKQLTRPLLDDILSTSIRKVMPFTCRIRIQNTLAIRRWNMDLAVAGIKRKV